MNKQSEKKRHHKLYSTKQTLPKTESLEHIPATETGNQPALIQTLKTSMYSRRTTAVLVVVFAFLLLGFLLGDALSPNKGDRPGVLQPVSPEENASQNPYMSNSGASGTLSENTETILSDKPTILPEETTEADNQSSDIPQKITLSSPDGILSVIGNPVAGDPLQFRIVNYDPAFTYSLNTGDGVWQNVSKETTYRYSEPGNYKAILSFQRPGEPAFVVSRFVKINAPEPDAEETPVASQETTLTKPIILPAETLAQRTITPTKTEPEVKPALPPASQPEASRVPEPPKPKTGTPPPVNTASTPMEYAEKMPEFPGGNQALNEFFNNQIRYPEIARENEVEGKVYVRFTVLPDGSATGFSVVRGIGFGCDEEALRIVRNMPKWKPGEHQGQKVSVIKTLPITFRFK
ncbi:MAG: TonB family protein [Bacteroidia bacterium]